MSVFDIPKTHETKSFGFTVYDAETGDPVNVSRLIKSLGGKPQLADGFMLTEDGDLVLVDSVGNQYWVAREGRYVIQFAINGCPYMKY